MNRLEMRLLKRAQVAGIDVQRIRKQVAFDHLLVRLFRQDHSPWVLKGGRAMEFRLKFARATQDIAQNQILKLFGYRSRMLRCSPFSP